MELWLDLTRAVPCALKERFYSNGLNGQVTVRGAADKRPLDSRSDLHDYSSSFEWGRVSAGAAQLSLALLADAMDNDARAKLLPTSAVQVPSYSRSARTMDNDKKLNPCTREDTRKDPRDKNCGIKSPFHRCD